MNSLLRFCINISSVYHWSMHEYRYNSLCVYDVETRSLRIITHSLIIGAHAWVEPQGTHLYSSCIQLVAVVVLSSLSRHILTHYSLLWLLGEGGRGGAVALSLLFSSSLPSLPPSLLPCSSGVQAAFKWRTSGVQVAFKWRTSGVQVAYKRRSSGVLSSSLRHLL